MERLQKVMAHAGIASRRKSEDIIAEGRVQVNGKVVTEMGIKVDPQQDEIKVDGELINKENRVYLLLYKPVGYITTVDDPQGRQTVLDLIDDLSQRIYPVGRLDYDTSGLILLTNDGDLTYVLTHPSFEIDKTYLVEVENNVTKSEIKQLREGIKLEDGITAPAEIKILDRNERRTLFTLTIHEGRNRQVRRMCKSIGHPVISLKRTSYAFLTLADLTPGEYRYLSEAEIEKLKGLAQK